MKSQQALILRSVDSVKSWGSERWLNATRPEAPARVVSAPGSPTLAEMIAAQPELLGEWSRRLFGDELPIFTKLIRANFPPLVHVGFKRAVARTELLMWLAREQALLRQLLAALEIGSPDRFAAFASLYSDWATLQARMRWRCADESALAARLEPFVARARQAGLGAWLGELRRNRAHLVETLNEIDLTREEGNLILTSAGVMHSIFGLSHQTHPRDPARAALQALYRRLRHVAHSGATDSDLRGIIAAASLPPPGPHPPKNEAWLPVTVGGQRLLVEAQQSSDTTYSLADFYTPFVWDGHRVRFRKGDASHGLRSEALAAQLDSLELGATPLDQLRRLPRPVPAASNRRAELTCLVDEPADWPFFTCHRLELDGRPGSAACWRGDHAPGLFQQLVVLHGEVALTEAGDVSYGIGPDASAFIPATMRGGYRLSTVGRASLLLLSLPGPRGGMAHE